MSTQNIQSKSMDTTHTPIYSSQPLLPLHFQGIPILWRMYAPQLVKDHSATETGQNIAATSTAAEGIATAAVFIEQPGPSSADAQNTSSTHCKIKPSPSNAQTEPPMSNNYYNICISDAAMQRYFADGRIYPKNGLFHLRD